MRFLKTKNGSVINLNYLIALHNCGLAVRAQVLGVEENLLICDCETREEGRKIIEEIIEEIIKDLEEYD